MAKELRAKSNYIRNEHPHRQIPPYPRHHPCPLHPRDRRPESGSGSALLLKLAKPQTGIGLRVVSDNQRHSFVGSVGADYRSGSQSWRGTVGGAYLGNDTYIGLDMGLGLDGSGFGVGVSGGGVGTKAGAQWPNIGDVNPDTGEVWNGGQWV